MDDKEIYQHVPVDEIAYHAGDGRTYNFELIDTGVEYTVKNPHLVFDESDHHLHINGIKSVLMAPKGDDGKYHYRITPAGLYITEGKNGHYWINSFYYNPTYDAISNKGGNRNSIGIESCIFDGVSYSKVMRKYANLVAHLLNLYNLGTD